MLREILLEDSKNKPMDMDQKVRYAVERQLAYFANRDGYNALMMHLGDNPFCKIFKELLDGFNETNPRRSVIGWVANPNFKSLIAGLTNFDPAKRITANEALGHKWFEGI